VTRRRARRLGAASNRDVSNPFGMMSRPTPSTRRSTPDGGSARTGERPYRVLLLAGRVGPDGLAYAHLQMAAALEGHGVHTEMLCKGLAAEPGEVKAPVLTWREVLRGAPLPLLPGLAERVVRQSGADLLHVLSLDLGSTGRAFVRRCRLPLLLSVAPPVERSLLLRRLQARAARVLASSEEVREDLVNRCRCPKARIALLPPGVDVGAYPLRSPRYGEHRPVVGVAGPLERRAGFDVFLRAANLVLRRSEAVRFVVAGDGHEEKRLRALAQDLGITEYVCFVHRLPRYRTAIEAMDIFVEPSLTETFPQTLLEAMAFGKAVVASGVGGLYAYLRDGETGRLVPKGDPEALSRAILDLLGDMEHACRLGRRARNRLREHHDLAAGAARLADLYREALSTPPRTL